MAIKDWKKVGKYKFQNRKNQSVHIVIDKYNDVWMYDRYDEDGDKLNKKTLKTKSQALRFARQYMRKH